MSKPGQSAQPAADGPPFRARREDAFRLARRKYLSGERIDIGRLAKELGVNRVTLYRWVGSKDDLLIETVWRLTELTLRQEWERLADEPGPRVPGLLGGYLRATLAQPGARRITLEQNERMMRLMTLASHGYQPRLIAEVRTYLSMDVDSGRITSDLSLDDLAYASVRIAESYHYLPTIAGQPPDPDGAERVLASLLRP